MDEPLEIRLLGPFEVLVGGTPVAIGGTKRAEVVALLAVAAGRIVGLAALADALWGERRPADARNAVQHHIARLRKALGAQTIVSERDGYALRAAVVDARRFEERVDEARADLRAGQVHIAEAALFEALGLWRGPALLGFLDARWAAVEAKRLEALRVDALEERFEAVLALDDAVEFLPDLRQAVTEHPFRERLWGQLMLALYRRGRQADALDAFHDARRVLSERLGLEPGPELRRLQAAILAHDPVVDASGRARRRERNDLPAPLTSFVDRRAELAEVDRLLRDRRLVTLVGPPGVGKSRMALEFARSHASEVLERIWLVELSSARAGDVGRAVATAIDPRAPGTREDVLARAAERLRDTGGLLVLDGCEHVAGEAAEAIATLLARCAGVRALATSREALRVRGETRLWVEPLDVPDVAGADNRQLVGYAAVRLFADRARDVRAEFELSPATARTVARICRRVDGLPLAIELAAARVGVLGLDALVARLDRRFARLVAGDRSAGEELSSLEEVIEWSYELLDEDERRLLGHLAVFRGGCPLSGAVALASRQGLDEAAATHVLSTLIDRSVVRASFPEGEARYYLLDTVRHFVLARVAEADGGGAARAAHAAFFADFADAAGREVRGGNHLIWLRRIELERENLLAALASAQEAGEAELAVRLAAGLGWYFALANLLAEGRAYVELALSVGEQRAPTPARIMAYAELCHLADVQGDERAAVDAGQRGLALAQDVSAARESATVQAALALALFNAGERSRAARLLDDARAGFGSVHDDWGFLACELIAAVDALRERDVTAVALAAERIVPRATEIGYRPHEIWGLLLQGWVAERRGDGALATSVHRRAVAAAHEPHLPHYVSFALAELGARAEAEGDVVRAELLQRRALAVAEDAGVPWFVAHACTRLARTHAGKGERDAAEALYRAVVDRAPTPAGRDGRETFFAALVGSPVRAARDGLGELAADTG